MQVFNKHKLEFVRIAVNRQKLKQKLISYRNYGQMPDPVEIAVLRKQIKEGVKNINKVIGGFLK